jgi:gamma-glutamyl:cysteine ligase YbdK (ATP-grasp superfamily)
LDEPVEPASGGRYGPDIEPRLSRVELDVRDLKDTQADLKSIVARIEAKLDAVLPYLATKADLTNMQAKLDATLPHLATKADLADKPGKTYMWGILAALLTAYACGLAALAVLK